MDGATKIFVKFLSMKVSNLSKFLRFWVADCRLFPIPGIMRSPASEAVMLPRVQMLILVPVLSLDSRLEVLLIPLWIWVENGVDPSTPVLLIRCRVLFIHALPNVASANISCTSGISSVCGASSIAAILDFVRVDKTETSLMVPKQWFWSIIPLLVWVTVSVSLARLTCASLVVALFKSYPTSFIVMLLTALTSSPNFPAYHSQWLLSDFSLWTGLKNERISSDVGSVCYCALFIFSHESQDPFSNIQVG